MWYFVLEFCTRAAWDLSGALRHQQVTTYHALSLSAPVFPLCVPSTRPGFSLFFLIKLILTLVTMAGDSSACDSSTGCQTSATIYPFIGAIQTHDPAHHSCDCHCCRLPPASPRDHEHTHPPPPTLEPLLDPCTTPAATTMSLHYT